MKRLCGQDIKRIVSFSRLNNTERRKVKGPRLRRQGGS